MTGQQEDSLWQRHATTLPSPGSTGEGLGVRDNRSLLRRKLLAAHRRVPIGEHAVRVVVPGPDVQLVEGRVAVAVRAADVVEELPHQGRRSIVLSLPALGQHQILYAE